MGLKWFMCSAWRGQDPRPGRRWVNVDELKSMNEDLQKTRERGIEDVEQNPVDKLLENYKDRMYNLMRARSQMLGRGWATTPFMSDKPDANPTSNSKPAVQDNHADSTIYGKDGLSRRFQTRGNSQPDPEYEIDPITNRKVIKDTSCESSKGARKSIEIPVKTFRGYRSQFQNFEPPKTSDPVRDSLKEYEKEEYQPVYYNEPEGLPTEIPDPVQEGLRDYDRKTKYEALRYNEPDGKTPEQPCQVQEALKEYDENTSYHKFDNNEPADEISQKPCPVQEGLKDYDHKVTYGFAEEPNGQPNPSFWQNNPKPCPVQEGLKDYDAKVNYGPVMYNEPDGKSCDPVQKGLRDYDSKANYGQPKRTLQNRIRDFLGRRNANPQSAMTLGREDTAEDLDLLRSSDVRAASGISKGPKKETEAEKRAKRIELEDDFYRPQGLEASYAEELAAAEKVKTTRQLAEDLRIENSELQNHVGHARGKVNAKIAEVEAGWPKESTAQKVTGNFVPDFPEEFKATWTTTKTDSGSLTPKRNIDAWGYDKTPQGLETSYQQEVENNVHRAEQEYIEGLAPKEAFGRHGGKPIIETSLDRNVAPKVQNTLEAERDPYSKAPQGLESSYADECTQKKLEAEKDPYSKVPQGLETSYIDECAQEKLQAEKDPYSKNPQGLETSYVEECAQKRLEAEKDPYSKAPQGLETSYAEELVAKQGEGDLSVYISSYGNPKCDEVVAEKMSREEKNHRKKFFREKDKALVREVREIYEDAYGTIDCKHRQIPEAASATEGLKGAGSAAETQEPTIYKILAYDPTMQSINAAETTSIVTDTASALTPAEVLLRLSNPAKFFPHFEPLKSQGYEIVSGSGDVLVFRKVRSGAPPEPRKEPATSSNDHKRRGANPIDGMQPIAATGNFASPTGFVNHDIPGEADPPFKSNIDVRREEPVFSGKRNWEDGDEAPKRNVRGRGKRLLIGAAWVGACSYAVGVVAEFFRTGGIDGNGPQGF
jgi:hypothetical protein